MLMSDVGRGESTTTTFGVRARFDDPLYVVAMSGELDLAARAHAIDACTANGHRDVLVDLSDLTFLDCAGHGAIDAARRILERRGGSLAVKNAVGEPRRLLALIEPLDVARRGAAGNGTLPAPRAATSS
jgi:anti-sigma B factor antagonist